MIVKTARDELIRLKGKAIKLGSFSLLGTLAIVGQAWFFANLINETFFEGKSLADVQATILCLLVAIAVRLGATYLQEQVAQDLAGEAKEELRHRIWTHLMRLGPFTGERHGDVVHLMTDGLENVEAYIARYVPQMLYAVMIPIVMAIAIIDAAPWVSIILLVTFPLIPFFMILIGRKAESMNKEQWERMSFLSGHFLDVLQGIVTLKLFGRSEEQVSVIERLSAEFRDSTLRVLRVAFLSALVLELISTISTALIAVYMGVALLYGQEIFLPAFFVLLLAPEFYAPLRQLGAAFHTGMAGQVSLAKVDEFLALPVQEPVSGSFMPENLIEKVEFDAVTYDYGAANSNKTISSNSEKTASSNSETIAKDNGKENVGVNSKHVVASDANKDLLEINEHADFLLQNISFTLARGHVTMLVGQSGAGKSTIAHLLLRLMAPTKGRILVDSTDLLDVNASRWRQLVTFVPQQPHLFQGTLRDNIKMSSDADDEAIYEALRQVEAESFVRELPKGLDTVVGEGGLGLSGGQKQRIALARAFLKQAPILVLDEITAHLDVATEQSLAKALQNLMKDRIVLMIGHRLQTMRWADQLLVMQNGIIVERGNFDELVQKGGYFSHLVAAGMGQPLEAVREEVTTSMAHRSDETNAAYVVNEARAEVTIGSATEITAETSTETTAVGNIITADGTSAAGDIKSQQFTSGVKKEHSTGELLSRLFAVLGPARNSLWLSLLFSFLTVFMNVGLLTASAWLITEAALQPELAALSLAIVGVRFFGISRAVCRYIERYVSHHMAFQGLYGLRVWFYKKLEPLAPAVFNRYSTGEMLGRIMADIETLQFFYLRVIIPPAGAVLLTIIGVYFLGQFSMHLVWLLLLAFFLGAVAIPYSVYLHNRVAIDESLMRRSAVKNTIVESLAGIMDILTYQQERNVSTYVNGQFKQLSRAQHVVERGVNLGDTMLLGLTQLTMVAGALIMVPLTHNQQEGVFIAVVAISLQSYFEALGPLAVAWYHGRESKAAIRRLVDLAEQPVAVEDLAAEKAAVNGEVSSNIDVNPAPVGIAFKNVSFAYDAKPVYENLSVAIKPKEKVALVGPSGSGKTTLLTLLERFYSYEGSIFLGNHELRDITISQARDFYGSLTQDTYLFHASIEDNIRLAKPRATAEELESALKFAKLDEWVNGLPKGLKTIIGSGGMGVSGGQRQRIALARLWLRNSPILLLDEPLEGLDQVVRQEIQNSLYSLMEDKTVICVTHHLGGLENMDRILFMDKGRIIEDGTYEELMAKKGSFYAYRKLSMETL
ncbi:MAG: thiol reductant ABC exporter subunit CydC [Veillonella sp.]|nr:thiol reductant ABC exporter subunit CydC [Veillonella sp.]